MKTEQQIETNFKTDFKALLEKYGARIEKDDNGTDWIETDGVVDKDGSWSEQPCYFTFT